jgi:poly-gamma-glutamate synthesis protein (capsule biosynthesis protein)
MRMRNFVLALVLTVPLIGCGTNAQGMVETPKESVVESNILETETYSNTMTSIEEAYMEETNTEEEIIESEESSIEPIEETYELSLIAVGDNLIHSPIYKKAWNGNTYDFTPMYSNIKDTIQSYDLAVINQETIFVDDYSNISSYPCFGTPSSMGEAIMDTGFNVVLSATNHTWDKGKTGYRNTLDYWKNYPQITLLGLNENEEDYNTINIVEKNNFKIAMFNYTYGLNGFTLPSDMPYAVNLLDNKEKFLNDVESIEDEVDLTMCFLHIGTEYTYTPTTYQVNYINDLIDAGADIIICAHPHVVEPYGKVTTPNGNTGLVYYSCGNFISNQNEVDRVLGGMASINLSKTVINGEVEDVSIDDYDFIPIVTHYNSKVHSIYKLEDYTEELAATHTLTSKGLSVDKLWSIWYKIVGYPDEQETLTEDGL